MNSEQWSGERVQGQRLSAGKASQEGLGTTSMETADTVIMADDRLEARQFSKENSAAFRSSLARHLLNRRHMYRSVIPEAVSKHEAEVVAAQERSEKARAKRLEDLSVARERLVAVEQENEEWQILKEELESVEASIEGIKTSVWQGIIDRFTDRMLKLQAQRDELVARMPHAATDTHVAIARDEYATKEANNQRLTQYEETTVTGVDARGRERLRLNGLVMDDDWVQKSRTAIEDFYAKNLALKRENESHPETRNVEEIAKQNQILLLHGFPTGVNSAETWYNNPTLDTHSLGGEDRALIMAALEPAISASSKAVDPQKAAEFWARPNARTEAYYPTGFILAGGEVMSAYDSDAATYARTLDSRHSKRDTDYGYTQAQVSEYQPDITAKIEKAIDRSGVSAHNEFVIRHPKIAALYLTENKNEWPEIREKQMDRLLGLAERMGLPVVEVMNSGELRSVTEGRSVTLEELMSNPVTYSPEERMAFLDMAQVAERMMEENSELTTKQIESKLDSFKKTFSGDDAALLERKKRNSDLARVRLKLRRLRSPGSQDSAQGELAA